MVRYGDWTDNERKHGQLPKKNFERTLKLLETIAQDQFKNDKQSWPFWKQGIKK